MKSKFVSNCMFASYITASLSNSRRLLLLLFTLVTILSIAIGCTGNSNDTVQPEPYFPVQKELQNFILQVSLPGKLVVDNGYLRVSDN